jgi:hypothetical protein
MQSVTNRVSFYLFLSTILFSCTHDNYTKTDENQLPNELGQEELLNNSFWRLTEVFVNTDAVQGLSTEIPFENSIPMEALWQLRFNSSTDNFNETFELVYPCAYFFAEYAYTDSVLTFDGTIAYDEEDCAEGPPVSVTPGLRTIFHSYLQREKMFIVEIIGDNKISVLSDDGQGFFATKTDEFSKSIVQ